MFNLDGRGGSWLRVSHISWDVLEARVVCRFLGYADVSKTFRDHSQHTFGTGTADVYQRDFLCNGSEENLGKCSQWTDGFNPHDSSDPAVICSNKTIPNQGKLNVCYFKLKKFHDKIWTSIKMAPAELDYTYLACYPLLPAPSVGEKVGGLVVENVNATPRVDQSACDYRFHTIN